MDIHRTIQFPLPHSCYPNCSLNSQNQLILLREVYPNESLTIDYATLFFELEPAYSCTCGCNGCRRKILGFNFLPVVFQDYYLQKDAVCRDVLSKWKSLSHYMETLSSHRERNTSYTK
jgi:hypothetical protein